MARARRGFKARQRRNKVLKLAKGFHFSRRTKFYHAAETVKRALHYRYIGRRLLKRDMRKLWIVRISAAAKMLDGSYSKFMGSLKKKNIGLNRKMLSEIAARDFDGFKSIYEAAK
ncbi:MAG: 50S ribosomal protein L20 [Bacteriovoracaceae bacterium]|nr:50S ribosomal protein L20 [Bacteriovoracaceae bacterium]